MALEQRVAFLEGRVVEHAGRLDQTNASIVRLEERMDARFDQVDRRFEQIDRRFEGIDRRFEQVDQRFDRLESRMSREFMWLVGMHVATLVAVVGALMSR